MRRLDATETMQAKFSFERMMDQHRLKVKKYRTNNGCFSDKCFIRHCKENRQGLTFCAVGAHHQNRTVEQKNQTVVTIARTVLLHAMSVWPEAISVSLWSFALQYAAAQIDWLNMDKLGYTPLEKLTRCCSQVNPELFWTFGCLSTCSIPETDPVPV